MMKWKECGKKRSYPNFKVLSQHLPGEIDENYKKKLSQDSLSPGRDLKSEFPEC
jgi:hypothetical protein